MAAREEPVLDPMALPQKSNMNPSSSATPLEINRGPIQKKVTSKNPDGASRSKRSTIDFQSYARDQAKQIQANLSGEFPSLFKFMMPTHVSGTFRLNLPKYFCEAHLPKVDTMIALECENGSEYQTLYLARKFVLCGGWRGFCGAHNLTEGDVLVFHLIQPCKFKVYIIKAHRSNEVDAAPDLRYVDDCMNLHDSNLPQDKDPSNGAMICCGVLPPSNQPENTRNIDECFGSKVLKETKLSNSTITSEEVKSMENFSLVVNGVVLDSELSKHLKTKYCELCCSQGMLLHENLLEGQNYKFVAGMICEIVRIADAIRASKITTSSDSFARWYKSLKALEMLGMKVGFLLARVEQLKDLASKSKTYIEARTKRDQAEEEKKVLELKLEEAKKTISRLDVELVSQNLNRERLEAEFEDLANSPWS